MRKTRTKTEVETVGKYAVLGPVPAPIIMEVVGDSISFRVKGSKKRFTMPIETAFREAITRTV